MTTTSERNARAHHRRPCFAQPRRCLAIAIGLVLVAGPAFAGGYCSATAYSQYVACKSEIRDDLWEAKAICINVSDDEERGECFSDAWVDYSETRQLCKDQRDARRDLCDVLGEARYEPDWDPNDFDQDFDSLTSPNPYFPLGIGDSWTYAGGDETIAVEVLDKTKEIAGVNCIVVKDVVTEDGNPTEDTDDWYGMRKDGTVDYCGELSFELETNENDDPAEPEVVEMEGSFKAWRDGDKPGTLFMATPVVGATYRQEWSVGNAEDWATVLSTSYTHGSDAQLDEHVPADLASHFCTLANPCVVTGEGSPIDPDVFERKYYGYGVGMFLEVDPESGATVELVACNVDPLCGSIP